MPERLHALDALRALALLLGIAFHASLSFAPGGDWLIADRSQTVWLWVPLYISHAFRLPVFFLMAGFFGRMICESKGLRWFVRDRAKRILVPLVAGWCIMYPFIAWLWILAAKQTGALIIPPQVQRLPAWEITMLGFATGKIFRDGVNLAHLWFLYYLAICYAAALLLRRLPAVRALPALLRSRWGILGLALPAFAAMAAGGRFFGLMAPLRLRPEVWILIAYGSFFAAGWAMHGRPALLEIFRRRWKSSLALAALLAAVMCPTLWAASRSPLRDGPWLAYSAGYALLMWAWVDAALGLALRFLPRSSAALRYVADASYWLYLAHLPPVLLLQVALADLAWHWSLKLALIHVLVLPPLLLSYHYLVRPTFVGAVLNGRRRPRGTEIVVN